MTNPAAIDELHPPPPRESYRDPESGVWILSRYAEVLTAFRETRLFPVDSKGNTPPLPRDQSGTLIARHEVMDALSSAHVNEWQSRMRPLADQILEQIETGDTVELLAEFVKPWCMSLAVMATGADAKDADRLRDITSRVFAGTVDPDSEAKARAKEAVAELDRYFENAPVPMTPQTFLGVAQTLPRLLVIGWLALFQRPDEVARLRAEPELMPRAVEELLRFAGLIRSVSRKASAAVDLGFVQFAAGDRATLMIGSANRDPVQFSEPNRLDISRRAGGQLSLGIGRAACAGARLIRMAHAVGIAAMLRRYERVDVVDAGRWVSDSGLAWPTSLRVAFHR
jgi:cytochrome P450